jgi:hypothetical protein
VDACGRFRTECALHSANVVRVVVHGCSALRFGPSVLTHEVLRNFGSGLHRKRPTEELKSQAAGENIFDAHRHFATDTVRDFCFDRWKTVRDAAAEGGFALCDDTDFIGGSAKLLREVLRLIERDSVAS